MPEEKDNSDIGEDSSMTVLCKGAYRFVVKKVLKTFPYPIAIVDELIDETPENTEEASDLVRRTMVGLKTMINHKLTPLEQSILEENGVPVVDTVTSGRNGCCL
jgi:Lon protease-like protein